MNYKINGQPVSKEEWDAHYQKRVEIYGDPLQDMLESHRAPMMGNSDRMFMEGANAQTLTHGLDEISAERSLTRAQAAGISTHGKVYMSQLGRPDNPLAWVSGIDDLKTSLKLQGKGCDSLGVKAVVKDPGPDIPLAADIIQEELENRLRADPDMLAKIREKPESIKDLQDQIVEDHAPRKR